MSLNAILLLLLTLALLSILTLVLGLLYFRAKAGQNKVAQHFQTLEHTQAQVLDDHNILSATLKAKQAQSGETQSLLSGQDDQSQSPLQAIRAAYSHNTESFWAQKKHASVPDGYWPAMKNSIPVMMIANCQNGSGKTSIAAYLAASYAAKAEKVLVIDLDSQGKLSQIMRAQSGLKASSQDKPPSSVERLLGHKVFDNWPDVAILDAQKNLDYISAGASLEGLERSLEYSWLLGDDEDDMRYRLARIILSSPIQSHYDRVILDSSSRVSAAFVNGFCAATHLFIPCANTRYAVQGLVQTTRTIAMLKPLNQNLSLGGVIPIKTKSEKENSRLIKSHILENSIHLTGQTITLDNDNLAQNPEHGLAGFQHKSFQKSFLALANELEVITKKIA